MSKIYCKNCFYYQKDALTYYGLGAEVQLDGCGNSEVWLNQKHPIEPIYNKQCMYINKNNNCKGFTKVGYKKEPIKIFGFTTTFNKTIKYPLNNKESE